MGQGPGLAQIDPNQPVIREQLKKIYQGLVDAGVEVYAIFTGGMPHRHCYREQLLDAFPTIRFNDKLRLEYFEANDHHFEWPPHRAWLLEAVESWLVGLSSAGHRTIDHDWGPSGENVLLEQPALEQRKARCVKAQCNSPVHR